MPLVVELDPEEIREDPRFPEQGTNYVPSHLKHYLSKQELLPATRVIADGSSLVLVGGHRYLRVARELGRKTIRAIVDSRSDVKAVEALKKIRRVVPAEEWDEEISVPKKTWHVFYFEEPLPQHVADAFKGLIESQFGAWQAMIGSKEGAVIHGFDFDLLAGRIEFEADTPIADEAWVGGFVAACRDFSKTVHHIRTYQGSSWADA